MEYDRKTNITHNLKTDEWLISYTESNGDGIDKEDAESRISRWEFKQVTSEDKEIQVFEHSTIMFSELNYRKGSKYQKIRTIAHNLQKDEWTISYKESDEYPIHKYYALKFIKWHTKKTIHEEIETWVLPDGMKMTPSRKDNQEQRDRKILSAISTVLCFLVTDQEKADPNFLDSRRVTKEKEFLLSGLRILSSPRVYSAEEWDPKNGAYLAFYENDFAKMLSSFDYFQGGFPE